MSSIRGKRATHVFAAGLAAALVAALLIVSPVAAHARDTGLTCAASADSEDAAAAMAKSCQREVMVDSATSERLTVTATPGGMLRAQQHVTPVRTRRSGVWVPVDTRLQLLPDGGFEPVASTVDVRFSRGGMDPLVTLTHGAAVVSLAWPAPLPTPSVEGDTAVYAEVLPGVDLRARATAAGFTHVLVVKYAAAAANPALAQIRYGWSVQGMTLRTRGDGGLDFVDTTGVVALSGAPGLMWDSSTSVPSGEAAKLLGGNEGEALAGDASSPVGPGDAARVAPVQVEVSGTELTVTPQQALLTGAATRFPVYIDPPVQATKLRWGYANTGGHDQSDGVARVGKNPQCCGGVWRSYFEFDVAPFAGKNIYDARLHTSVTHTSSCSASPVSLWHTANMAAGVNGTRTGWAPAMWQWLDEKSVEANTGCGDPSPVEVTFAGFLVNQLKAWVAGNSVMTLGLATYDSSGFGETVDYWKKVDPTQVWLTVWYNTAPNPPVVKPFTASVCYLVCASSTAASTSGSQTQGWWKLNETSGTTAADSSPSGRTGTGSGGMSWSDGAVVLNGTNAAVTTATSPLDVTRSFTVSLWAKRVSGGAGCHAAVTQVGQVNPGFWVGTCGDRWEFGRSEYDSGAPAGNAVAAQSPFTLGAWTHLVGVYNDLWSRFTFYVNGVAQGSVLLTTAPFAAGGGLQIGRSKYNSVIGSYFAGSVDNVQTYQRELAAADVTALYAAGRAGGALRINAAVVRSTTPTMSVDVSDPDPGALLQPQFEIRAAATDTSAVVASSGVLPQVGAPTTVSWTVPSGKLSNGGTYFWRARAHDELGWTGAWTPFAAVTVDISAPSLSTPPVTSAQYPLKQWGAVVGTQGSFALSASSTDTHEFEWWVDNAPVHTITAAAGSGPRTATVTYTPASPMKHIMHVKARDLAGWEASYDYEFWVTSSPNVYAHWALNEAVGATVAADSGNAPSYGGTLSPATRAGAVNFGPGWVKDAGGLTTNGLVFTGDGTATATGPVIDTTKAFTAMAWVNPSNLTVDRTVLSGDGTNSSRWQLGYRKSANGGNGGWCFSMRASDGATPVDACADGSSLGYPVTGTWVHIAAVYNPALTGQQLRVYVMGDPQQCFDPIPETATASMAGTWSALEPFVIGRAKSGGASNAYWRGSVDDVWAHQAALTGQEICMHAQPTDD